MNKTVEILLSTFASGTAIKLLTVFEASVQPKWLALTLAALAGAVVFTLLRLVYAIPMQFHQIRRYLDQKYGIEGYWLEIVDDAPSHSVSFAWIRYNPKRNAFQYRGRNFNSDMSIYARWLSCAVVTDESIDRIHFLFEADLVRGAESIRGHGVLEFSHYVGKVFTSIRFIC